MISNRDILIAEHYDFINEAYFGKTEALLELEKAIGILREDYSFKKDYTATPELKRIENAVIKQFNMEYFSLNIIPQNIPNAFTYDIGSRFDIIKENVLSKIVIADSKNGYRFRDNNGIIIIVCIYGGLLANPNFSDAEIVAIILHEIGHNFSEIISGDVKLANQSKYDLWLLIIIMRAIKRLGFSIIPDLRFTVTNTNRYQVRKKQNEREHGRVYAWMKLGGNRIKEFAFNTKKFCKRVIKGALLASFIDPEEIMINKRKSSNYYADMKKNPYRQDEVIADKFSAIYGYGPEQFTALQKLESTRLPADEVLEKLPFGHMLLKFNTMQNLDYFKDDAHPDIVQRMNTMIESLEFELKKKNLDPEMRKIIEKQLKEMQWIKSEYFTIAENDDDIAIIEKTYALVIEDKMPEATTKKLEKEINQQIDDLCNKKY